MEFSVISPVYLAENILDELCKRLLSVLTAMGTSFEIILVEDGSPDKSWQQIEKWCKKDDHIKGVKLSRNFGQHNAIAAGIKLAKGDWVIVMDCDLQDSPEEIPALYSKALEGYDIVFAKRFERQDGWLKKLYSKWFYATYAYFTNTKQDETIANFGIYSRNVIEAINKMGDYERVFPTLVQWVGYKKVVIEVKHNARYEGKSSYSFGKLFVLAFQMIISFSDKPLRLALITGTIISISSFCFGIFYLVQSLRGIITEPGFASLIISIWFLGGTILIFIGVLGLYIGKIFEKVKNRPNYLIQEIKNID
ncbi:glycosyltransferase [soil metagenome]